MQPIIRVEGLSKRYRITRTASGAPGSYRTLREDLVRLASAPLRRLRGGDGGRREDFWALRDVNFEVQPGEVVGIIGRNGAGKSTLLKILSRITKPTSGQVELRGRVGSLLEVGTGFHPELTGRENIFLNGAILGMSRREITAKFDEIVAFSEIERFLDTPVKRYSSGMYVRLAFAVAAHLDPEILIVDEVLAVGDGAFQKKCLGKMKNVAGCGRTVLFVSHNMNAITALCGRAILLGQGRVQCDGSPEQLIQTYIEDAPLGTSVDLTVHPNRAGSLERIFRRVEFFDEGGRPTFAFASDGRMEIRLCLKADRAISSPKIGVGVTNWRGERVFAVATYLGGGDLPQISGQAQTSVRFRLPMLVPGAYQLDISLKDHSEKFLDEIIGSASFEVINNNHLGTTTPTFPGMGSVMVQSEWSLIETLTSRSSATNG